MSFKVLNQTDNELTLTYRDSFLEQINNKEVPELVKTARKIVVKNGHVLFQVPDTTVVFTLSSNDENVTEVVNYLEREELSTTQQVNCQVCV